MLTTSVRYTKKNPGLRGENTGRNRQTRIRLCERTKKKLGLVYKRVAEMWNGKGCKKGVKNPNFSKKTPGGIGTGTGCPLPLFALVVPVHVRAVLVPLS